MAARIVLTVLVALLVGTGSAFADNCASISDCTYTLNTVNDTGALGSLASYGTVELKLNGPNIDFIVSLVSGYRLFKDFGFNSIDPDLALSVTSTSDPANWLTGTLSPGANHIDGFGDFEYALTGPVQKFGTQTLDFTISRSGGFADVRQLVEGSTGGGSNVPSLFAAHIINDANANTGYVGVTAGSVVPEPSSYLWLMGAGFGLLILVFERRRRRMA